MSLEIIRTRQNGVQNPSLEGDSPDPELAVAFSAAQEMDKGSLREMLAKAQKAYAAKTGWVDELKRGRSSPVRVPDPPQKELKDLTVIKRVVALAEKRQEAGVKLAKALAYVNGCKQKVKIAETQIKEDDDNSEESGRALWTAQRELDEAEGLADKAKADFKKAGDGLNKELEGSGLRAIQTVGPYQVIVTPDLDKDE